MQGGLVRVLAPRYGEYRLALGGIAAYVGGLAIVGAASHLRPMAVAGLALVGFGSGAFSPSASALASRQADAGNRGVVMGTYQSGTSLARVLGPFSSGADIRALWSGSAVSGGRAGDVAGGVVHARSAEVSAQRRGGVIFEFEGNRLVTKNDYFYVAAGAQLIGDVHLGEGTSVWFNAVLRADDETDRDR